jgi:plastocyanin
MRSMKLLIGVTCLCALMSGCSRKDSPVEPTGDEFADVYTPGMVFTPTDLTVSVGTTVRFNIFGDIVEGHDVTFRAATGAPASIPVTKNAVVERKFNAKGTFRYDCFTHPGMSGTIVVQ